MNSIASILRGVWEFVVGDDPRVAFGVAAAIALTALIATATSAWWVLPLSVVALLGDSLRRAASQARKH